MSVDVFTTYGPAGKLIERPGGPCPDWCVERHLSPRSDDGVHCSEVLIVRTSQHRDDNGEMLDVCANVQHFPGGKPFVMLTHHDEATANEDPMTADEAVKAAEALEWNAEVIRACGNNTCWCEGQHGPREEHWGERKDIPLTLTSRPYIPKAVVSIVRDWDAPAALVQLVSHTERFWDLLTADEADQLAKNLRRCAAIVAFHQAAQLLAAASR